GGNGPSQIFVNLDQDGVGGAAGFGPRVLVTQTNVGGFELIPAQPRRGIDAEATLLYDPSVTSHGRVYLVYTGAPHPRSPHTDIGVRSSDDEGRSWTGRVRVNNDASGNSQFMPQAAIDPMTGALGVAWYDARNAGPGNDTVQVFAAVSIDGGTSFPAN